MKVVGFAGRSGSGKTTLVEQLIPLLKRDGRRVSVIKHAHHNFEIDQPGKDTFRHRKAGAYEVVVASDLRVARIRELPQPARPDVHTLIAELDSGVDWVLVEGFKRSDLPKVEVWRAAAGAEPLYVADPMIAAIATDSPECLPASTSRAILDLNRPEHIAGWLDAQHHRFDYSR